MTDKDFDEISRLARSSDRIAREWRGLLSEADGSGGSGSEPDSAAVDDLLDALGQNDRQRLDAILISPPWGDGTHPVAGASGLATCLVAAVATVELAEAGSGGCPGAGLVARLLGNAISDLQDLRNSALKRLISTDELTGCLSRGALFEALDVEIARAVRHGRSISVMYLDVDGLKSVNDTRGHTAGDQLLRDVGGIVRRNLRSSDVVGRVGGDEFVVLLPDTDREGGIAAGKKLIGLLSTAGYPVSIGVAGTPHSAISGDELIAAADRGLRSARRAGGAQVAAGG